MSSGTVCTAKSEGRFWYKVDRVEHGPEKQIGADRRRLPGLTLADGYMRHPFDLKYGVRTSGLVAGRYLKSGHRHDRHATAYYGVAPSVFQALVRRWTRSGPVARLEETTFVDVGAGMGRGMLLASEMNFLAVIGVELNPVLVRIARRNLAQWRKTGRAQSRMRLVCEDAAEFVFPQGPCVAFLFNPFSGAVMRRFLRHAARSFADRPRIFDLVYVNNEQEGILESSRGFVRVFLGQVPRSREDAIADHRILANQPDGEYASANYEDCSIWRWVGRSVG
jgi:SAM-dependent methyltransferase